jgi:hypothetical protein
MISNNPYGEYTIANIKATQGFIEGGVSGGWILYFVYEDTSKDPKYITLYDGFAHVYNKPISINLSDFFTPKSGNINSKITMAALEGDFSIDGDNVRLKSTKSNRYFPLSSKIRNANNFFNSQITIEEEHFENRKPNSLNNKNNQIIDNNTSETEIKISSMGDKVYLFSTGFSIDVDQEFFVEKSKEKLIAIKEKTINKELIEKKNTESKNAVKKEKTEVSENQKGTKVKGINIKITEIPTLNTEENDSIRQVTKGVEVFEKSKQTTFVYSRNKTEERTPKEIRTITTKTNLKYGYYLIVNVFAYPHNAENYAFFLKQNNIRTGYFTNPENDYRYVFLKRYNTEQEVLEAYNSNYNNTFFDDYWILKIDK